ncbi:MULTISPECIES: S1C family serine protease [Tsukamurella]|uniref:PDZ domain-containing protein n=2 Tax=Tsukamurella TaxID=2060 RepID=A0A5C5RVF4_9ACTN|nr:MULTISPECIES: trypsin-like peptidase domain-containing protein [Tsukamurella]NMD58270.1 PDZ domain-containing protein [Tsukamurella columbiensis]TWS27019.1 PDZ domain-containing protein [Tsukamurella conjunctivitidis]
MTSDPDARRPRLEPRPTHRPTVSEGEQVVFGRPDGVDGAFAPESVRSATARGPQPQAAAPDPVLTEAFSRPPGATEALQRDPYAGPLAPEPEPAPEDPWRDTESLAGLGEPGVAAPPRAVPQPDTGRLGVRDVLFGRRVSVRALAILGVLALVIGLLGGAIGRITGTTIEKLTDSRVSLPAADGTPAEAGAVASMVGKVGASVVTIEVRTKTSGETGSGSVIDAERGYIMTNNHVVETASTNKDAKIEVVFFNGTRTPAQLVGTDPYTDVAVVKVSVDGLQQIARGDSSALVAGQQVVAIGSPLGLRRTVTSGVVSATHRPVQGPANGPNPPATFDSVQTDAAINPGNSGGPLLDLQGRQIGINTLGLSPGGVGSIGLNFAIASDVAWPIAESIIRGQKVVHADLGINGREVSNETASGVRVENVKKGGAAEKAGIREGDVITKVGDTEVAEAADVIVAIRATGVGKETTVTVARDGRQVPITVTPEPLS